MAKRKIGRLQPVVPSILYRNQVTLLGASPYAGKSRLCLMLAAQLAEGKETMFGKFEPLTVLYCSERDWDMTTTQFASLGYKDIPDNLTFFCVPDLPKNKEAAFRVNPLQYITAEVIEKMDKPPDVVVLDTIADFQNISAKLKVNDYGPVRMSIMSIQRWAITHNFAVLALAHAPKENENSRYKNPVQRVLGSVAVPASTIALFILEAIDPEGVNEYVRLYQISHVAKLEPPVRYFHKDAYREVDKDEAEGRRATLTSITEREAEMLELIGYDWADYTETLDTIKRSLEMSTSNVLNYFKRLVTKGQLAIDHGAPEGKLIKRFRLN